MILGHLKFYVTVILDESLLVHEADRQPPHKIDENMWKNREHIEEILFLLETSHWPAVVRYKTPTYCTCSISSSPAYNININI
jgi:hypothetical protein